MNAQSDFHFIRPLWLMLIPVVALLWWLTRRMEDPLRGWRREMEPRLLEACPIVWFAFKLARMFITTWRARHNRPSAVAWRELKAACKANNPAEFYWSMMAWLQTREEGKDYKRQSCFLRVQPFKQHWDSLSRSLFGTKAAAGDFNGREFWNAFVIAQQRVEDVPKRLSIALPLLNPSADRLKERVET